MSTIPGSKKALIFEELIVDYIISSENLQYLWAACRYSILIHISELANVINPNLSRQCLDREVTSASTILLVWIQKPVSDNVYLERQLQKNMVLSGTPTYAKKGLGWK